MFEIEFYEDERGSNSAYDFVKKMENRKLQAKIVGSLEVLSEKGIFLREPYCKHLEDSIFELRCTAGNDTARLLYFYNRGRIIVITNGFIKKTRRVPAREIALAKRRRQDYLARRGN